MHFNTFAAALLGVSTVAALESPHKKAPVKPKRTLPSAPHTHTHRKRQSGHLNSNTAKFAVNGSAIPDVNFNIGESYAGTLPIDGNSSNANQLWFWFFPSENQAASDEIVIWLNGGPG
ncbi:MAG: hypothetical protein Q9165_002606 [Trypethelium subeluteriae]